MGDRTNYIEAEQFLREDLRDAEKAVENYVHVPLNQNQHDALVSLVYNIGSGNFKKSTTLRELNSGNYENAGEAIKLWNKAGGKVSNGLVRRRNMEYNLYKRRN